MIRRRRPLLRAAAVAGGAYMAGKRTAHRRADEEQADAEQDGSTGTGTGTSTGGTARSTDASLSDQLDRLMDLHRQGMLTDQEFSAAKAKLLGI
jgi:hypothetical protein